MERVWGGDRISTVLGRKFPADRPIGESWEVYGELTIANGPLAGRTLDQAVRRQGAALVGSLSHPEAGFPLLTKWLDCHRWLSVQVHPDDALARELTGDPLARGKTECWFFHRCDPGASYIHGLVPGADPRRLRELQGRAVLELLREIEARPGTFCLTEAGTVHALGPGLMLYEIQQSSDLTYRLYDWDRPGLDGRARPLHLEESCRSMLEARPPRPGKVCAGLIGRVEVVSPFFVVERLEGDLRWETGGDSFEILTSVDEPLTVRAGGVEVELAPGAATVVPAQAGEVVLGAGPGSCLRTRVPAFGEGPP